MPFIAELKRRNVIRMAGLYLVSGWLIVQVAQTLLPAFDVSTGVVRAIVLVLAIGFLPALAFAWVFELTPEGIKRDADVPIEQSIGPQTARRMEHVTVVVLALALAYFALDKFVLAPKRLAAQPTASATAVAAPAGAATGKAVPAANRKSIAVLPFENLSEDKANAFFADGVQDQILTSLAKIGELKVISRTSTQSYASRPGNLHEIARELGVANILEGSVQKAGNRVRINVQLIEAATDTHLWAETYDRNLDDIFAVQSEVSQKIAEAMAATISQKEREALQRKPTDNPAAYRAYLAARAITVGMSSSKSELGTRLAGYREAVKLDPQFALAWAELAWEENRAVWVGIDESGALQAEANAALARAQALAPELPQVELARAVNLYYEKRQFRDALTALQALHTRAPGNQDVLMFIGFVSRRVGDYDASIAAFRAARELAPNDATLAYHLGVTYSVNGDCPAASEPLDASLAGKFDPSTLFMRLQCQWQVGDLDGADAVLARFPNTDAPTVALRGMQAMYRHDFAAASALFAQAIAHASDLQSDASFNGYIEARVDWQLKQALLEQRLGHAAQAKKLNEGIAAEARKELANPARNPSVRAAWHSALGLALAQLGEADAARGQGAAVREAVPEDFDRLEGPAWADFVVQIDAINGDAGRALPGLKRQLKTRGSFFSPSLLVLDPVWDPIRTDPGFQALLKK